MMAHRGGDMGEGQFHVVRVAFLKEVKLGRIIRKKPPQRSHVPAKAWG